MGQGEEEVAPGKEWVDARSDKVWHEDKKCAAQMLVIKTLSLRLFLAILSKIIVQFKQTDITEGESLVDDWHLGNIKNNISLTFNVFLAVKMILMMALGCVEDLNLQVNFKIDK